MHQLARANDRVHRAWGQAFKAPDATIFVDDRYQRRALDAIFRIEGQRFAIQQRGQRGNGRCATGRALIDLCKAGGDRLSVGAAAVITATGALGLRQESVYVLGGWHVLGLSGRIS
jgi:hypothetical protein